MNSLRVIIGWPPNAIHRQPSNHTGQECVTLARRFYDPWNLVRDVGYYFWNDAPCNVRIPYVCKKLGSSQTGNMLITFVYSR